MKILPSRLKSLAVALPVAAAFMVGCWDDDDDNGTGPVSRFPQATATASAFVKGYADSAKDSAIHGTVTFKAFGDSVLVQGSISGLTKGKAYAIHVHQFGNCSTPNASGDHFGASLERHGNPFDTVGSHHRGDLPNLQVDSSGVGHFELLTDAINLDAGVSGTDTTAILDSLDGLDTLSRSVIGRSVVVHSLPDDYFTQPAGNSDGRIACGVIRLTTGSDTTTAPLDTNTVPADTTGNPGDTADTNPTVPIPGSPGY
jgi:Cu-Zn family superoxide dismutase